MKLVVLISAGAEWRALRTFFPGQEVAHSPFGEWFESPPGTFCPVAVIFFHGGWGKISAAATAQYVLDRFQPALLINLGTCGGFEGRIATGTLLLVEKTIVYDIFEQMGDGDAALEHYATGLDLSWLPGPLPAPLQCGLLVSADRDLLPADIPWLVSRFQAVAADWESGAIAWVAQKNHARCLILRGVSDLVSSGGGEAYGNLDLFRQRTAVIMGQLIVLLKEWIPALLPALE